MTRYLISTKPLLCRCVTCHEVIWYAIDQGLVVQCDTQELSLIQEIRARLAGWWTFNLRRGHSLWYRDQWSISYTGPVIREHVHQNGFYEMEPKCRTETSKKATDSNLPPY